MIYQWLLIIFASFAILLTANQYRKERVSLYWLISWSILWLAVIAVAFAPQVTDVIANRVGVEKGADLIVYTAVVVFCYAMYRVLVRQEEMQREITRLVREVAILEAKKARSKDL